MAEASIQVTVCWSLQPRQVHEHTLSVPAPTSSVTTSPALSNFIAADLDRRFGRTTIADMRAYLFEPRPDLALRNLVERVVRDHCIGLGCCFWCCIKWSFWFLNTCRFKKSCQES